MKAINSFVTVILLTITVLTGLTACRQEADTIVRVSNVDATVYKVAVVLPIGENSEYKTRFERTVKWALENLRSAQKLILAEGDTVAVSLELEWHDEERENLDSLSSALAYREDVFLVIGPYYNENVDVMAKACSHVNKPIIVPSASSEDVIRRYSVDKSTTTRLEPFLWSLCETDVSQSEALLAKAWEGGAKTVALLSPDDVYGKTFYDWLPFQSDEMGMTLMANEQFVDTTDVTHKAQSVLGSGADCAVCVTRTAAETRAVLEVRRQLGDKAPRLLFSNEALSPALLQMGALAEGVEGVAQYADPSTGFQIAYEARFGESPAAAEAQLYDAVLLTGMAAFTKQASDISDTNEILRVITSVGTEPYSVWSELGLRSLILLLRQEHYVELVGASGPLRFDSEAYTSLLQSTYVHWMVYNGRFITIDYTSSDGSKRTASTLASWNWQAQHQQTLVDQDAGITYGSLGNKYAVLIQGTNKWENYRHQADVLNVYQFLKSNGYDDDHIILILSDDIAHNEKNKNQGEVRSYTDGPELYGTARIDYSNDTLTVWDLQNILSGHSSSHLPVVLNTDRQSNILMFWSGHGSLASSSLGHNGFVWGENGCYSDTMLRQWLTDMHEEGRYRKMLMFFEPCYSQNMARQTDGIPGVLAFCSSNGAEQSFADFFDWNMGIWLSDRFSSNLVTSMRADASQTYRSLYLYLSAHTLGSHVHVENASMYGNLYTSSPREFFTY